MDSIEHTALDVSHDEAANRYVLRRAGDHVGVLDYQRRADGALDMVHTGIDPASRGHGLGAVLVRHALDDVRATGGRVIPSCWYVREFIDADADDYASLLADPLR